jgi:hypothetical protein
MLKLVVAGCAVAFLAFTVQDEMKKPAPEKEHAWLKQLTGRWDVEIEATMKPGAPPTKMKGAETSRMVGDFWYFGENTGTMMNEPFVGLITVGYGPQQKKFVGTWVDNMSDYMWKYEGSLDAGGKSLTLNTEGPCPMLGGRITKFKEVIEVKDADHKVFTSSYVGDDGKWTTVMTATSTRKK